MKEKNSFQVEKYMKSTMNEDMFKQQFTQKGINAVKKSDIP